MYIVGMIVGIEGSIATVFASRVTADAGIIRAWRETLRGVAPAAVCNAALADRFRRFPARTIAKAARWSSLMPVCAPPRVTRLVAAFPRNRPVVRWDIGLPRARRVVDFGMVRSVATFVWYVAALDARPSMAVVEL